MAALIASAAAAAIAGIASAVSSGKASKRADKQAKRAEARARDIERGRQKVINPYENVSNLSAMAKDLSGMASNPYSNLSVATGAAEMQYEETDIALANTLDTLRATGSSAGGATALAQAALQSKKGISANIEQQEVNNEKLRAEGEQKLQMIKMSEAQRIQSVNMSEAARMQNAEVMGKSYMFETKEQRDARDLARYSAKEQNAQAQANAYKSAQMQAIGTTISSLGNITAAGIESGAIGKSDRRLKKNIKLIGYSPSGLRIYAFEYINKLFGEGIFQGVMSDEIPKHAIVNHSDGFDRVDYSQLDVEFKKINKL